MNLENCRNLSTSTDSADEPYINGSSYAETTKACTTEICSFSYEELRGSLYDLSHGGPYTVKLIANGGGASASATTTFSLDKTPTVSISAPTGTLSAPFDIVGTATFKPTLNTIKGWISLYINGSSYAETTKACTTETCSFSYKELRDSLYDLSHGGPYTAKLIANGGGVLASATTTFSVDKTPTVSISAPTGTLSAPFDIVGTATFKPTLNTIKGWISLYINGSSYATITKACTTEICSFGYQEIKNTLYTLPPGGPYSVMLIARGGSGGTVSDQKTFYVVEINPNDYPRACPSLETKSH